MQLAETLLDQHARSQRTCCTPCSEYNRRVHGRPDGSKLSQAGLDDDRLTDPECTDAQLARRIAASSVAPREAIAELYRRFWPRLRSFGLRHVKHDEAARDLAQRVLLLTVDKLQSRRGARPRADRIVHLEHRALVAAFPAPR